MLVIFLRSQENSFGTDNWTIILLIELNILDEKTDKIFL